MREIGSFNSAKLSKMLSFVNLTWLAWYFIDSHSSLYIIKSKKALTWYPVPVCLFFCPYTTLPSNSLAGTFMSVAICWIVIVRWSSMSAKYWNKYKITEFKRFFFKEIGILFDNIAWYDVTLMLTSVLVSV